MIGRTLNAYNKTFYCKIVVQYFVTGQAVGWRARAVEGHDRRWFLPFVGGLAKWPHGCGPVVDGGRLLTDKMSTSENLYW